MKVVLTRIVNFAIAVSYKSEMFMKLASGERDKNDI